MILKIILRIEDLVLFNIYILDRILIILTTGKKENKRT